MENAASARLAGTVICAIARLAGTVVCAIARLAGTESHVRSPGPVKVRAKQCNSIVRKPDSLFGHAGAMAHTHVHCLA